ncbi:hypothetical protein MKW98_027401 [Papaver atlanticum]|uniref:Helicase C-terminal domain-containing protein n=1 Tax=Papaver atlanticum TaxID=357466 RepID=A0AAD4XXR5_9MAGN|nr:hypothetical protein MKW98_027401 [Papaver atlanticum]
MREDRGIALVLSARLDTREYWEYMFSQFRIAMFDMGFEVETKKEHGLSQIQATAEKNGSHDLVLAYCQWFQGLMETIEGNVRKRKVAAAFQFHLPLPTTTSIHHQHSTCSQETTSAASFALRRHHSTVTKPLVNISSSELLQSVVVLPPVRISFTSQPAAVVRSAALKTLGCMDGFVAARICETTRSSKKSCKESPTREIWIMLAKKTPMMKLFWMYVDACSILEEDEKEQIASVLYRVAANVYIKLEKCDEVAEALITQGLHVVALHGGRSQSERQAALRNFRNSSANILVATDVASRGLDVTRVAHVINLDLPKILPKLEFASRRCLCLFVSNPELYFKHVIHL